MYNFKDLYDKNGDNLIVDNYPLKQGVYIIVNDKGIKDFMVIKDKEAISKDKEELFKYLRHRDYLSILKQYDTNKAVSGRAKSIHSNNFLSLFIRENKSSHILEGSSLNPSLEQQVGWYFDQFKKWQEEERQAHNNNDPSNPQEFILTTLEDFDEQLFNKSKKAILNSLSNLPELLNEYTLADKDYIRIFYEMPIEYYNKEYKRYMIRKIFNKNVYHIFKDNNVYGISDIDLTTNNNKPSLLLYSMKTRVPLRLDFDTLLIAQKLFDFLYFYKVPRYNKESKAVEYVNSIYKTLYIPMDFNIDNLDLNKYTNTDQPVYYITTGNGQSFNVINYDIIYPFDSNIDFSFNDYLSSDEDVYENNEDSIDDTSNISNIKTLLDLERIVDKYFFNFNLVSNYHSDKFINNKKYTLPNNISCMLFSSKHLFHDWFRKGIDIDIIDPITNVMDNLISLWANDPDISLIKIKNMLNLRWSILDYLYEREGYAPMEVKEHFEAIRYNLKEKIHDKSLEEKYINNTEEFYYACGQLIYYLLTQNKKTLKKQQATSKFLQCRNSSTLKIEILKLYEEVANNISAYNYRFNNLYSMVSTYNDSNDTKDYIDYLLGGLYQSNIIYEKKKKETVKYNDCTTII